MLEVCVDSLESAINAIYNGADEVEVCSCLPQGGLTPSPGLVKQVLNVVERFMESEAQNFKNCSTKKPKVNVMIRCRAGSDFCYTNLETDTMLDDIDIFKTMGVDRFVFGSLTDTRQVDDIHCIRVLAQAYPTPVTFHRAFDLCLEPIAALEEIMQLGFSRVLTSGQKRSADDNEAVELIKMLIKLYGDKIEIMPGAGINADNVKTFAELGCKIVHSSCKILRPLVKIESDLSMGDSDHVYLTEGTIVKKIKSLLSDYKVV